MNPVMEGESIVRRNCNNLCPRFVDWHGRSDINMLTTNPRESERLDEKGKKGESESEWVCDIK